MTGARRLSRAWRWRLALALAALAVVGAYSLARFIVLGNGWVGPESDFFTFWAAGWVVGHGGNPYDPAQWQAVHQAFQAHFMPNPTCPYPLPTAVLFAPLGFLSETNAAIVWVTLSQVCLLAATVAIANAVSWWRALRFAPFLVLGLALFRPAVATMMVGQMGGLLAFIIALAAWLWSREQWFWGGFALGWLLVKPAGPALFLLAAAGWLLWRRQWRGLAGMAATLFLSLLVTELLQPAWPIDWLTSLWHKTLVSVGLTYPPTIWGVLALALNLAPFWTVVAGVLSAGGLVAGLWAVTRLPPVQQWLGMLGVVLPLALMVSPYLWSYDHVVVWPVLVVILARLDERGWPVSALAGGLLAFDLFTLGLLWVAYRLGYDIWGILVPLATAGMFVAVRSETKRQHANA